MHDYVEQALSVYSKEIVSLVDPVLNNPFGVEITPLECGSFLASEGEFFDTVEHFIGAGTVQEIKSVLRLAVQYKTETLLFSDRLQRL